MCEDHCVDVAPALGERRAPDDRDCSDNVDHREERANNTVRKLVLICKIEGDPRTVAWLELTGQMASVGRGCSQRSKTRCESIQT